MPAPRRHEGAPNMRMQAFIAGVGMTHFGKHMDLGLKTLGAEAVKLAVADAGVDLSELEAAWVGNAAAGLMTGQESIRGQVEIGALDVDALAGEAALDHLVEFVEEALRERDAEAGEVIRGFGHGAWFMVSCHWSLVTGHRCSMG